MRFYVKVKTKSCQKKLVKKNCQEKPFKEAMNLAMNLPMARPERCTVLAGESPDRVNAGAPSA
jgi:hypothetical protein